MKWFKKDIKNKYLIILLIILSLLYIKDLFPADNDMDYCMDNGICKEGLTLVDGSIISESYCNEHHQKWLKETNHCCLIWSTSNRCK